MDSPHSFNLTSGDKKEKRKRETQSCKSDSDKSITPSETGIQEVTDQGDEPAIPRTASSGRTRNGLNRDKAMEIYARRPDEMGFRKSRRGTMVGCEAVAVEFGVTPKTIRDIWRGRTWGEATGHPQADSETRSVPPRRSPSPPLPSYPPTLPHTRARVRGGGAARSAPTDAPRAGPGRPALGARLDSDRMPSASTAPAA
jgi:hypothetical protein